MLNCYRTRKNLTAFLAGELGTAKAARIEGHLAGCPACVRERDTTDRFLGQVGALEGISPSSGFEATFWKKAAEAGTRRPVRKAAFGPGWAVRWGMRLSTAAAILLVFSVYLLVESPYAPPPVTPEADSAETAEIVKSFEFYRDFEVIEAMDRLLEIEEDMAGPESGRL